MAHRVLHFSGLKPGTHTWFYNRRGAQVRIEPGAWVIVDDARNPFWERWVRDGEATEEIAVPDGVVCLDENADPRRPITDEAPSNEPLPWGAFAILGGRIPIYRRTKSGLEEFHVTDLSSKVIERIRLQFMPRDLPGFRYVDARRDRRAGRKVARVKPPFEVNFLVLVRLAWLRCRRDVERKLRRDKAVWMKYQAWESQMGLKSDKYSAPGLREIRESVESATAEVLYRWELLATPKLPNRVTLYRQLKNCGLEVRDLDVAIACTWDEILESGRHRSRHRS